MEIYYATKHLIVFFLDRLESVQCNTFLAIAAALRDNPEKDK